MPDTISFTASTAPLAGGTLFERMCRAAQAPVFSPTNPDMPRFLRHDAAGARGFVAPGAAPAVADDAVRFVRGDADGKPTVVLQERGSDGVWRDSWSLPTESLDAREGMMGWINTQGHRWSGFARMFHRRGGDELTRWIFELMVVPSTAQARPPRFEPQRWPTIQHYARPSLRDDCGCRPGSIQHTRDF